MQRTKIEYLSHTWNPLKMRCTQVSAGCKNCWHLRMANRQAKNPTLSKAHRAASAGGVPFLDEKELLSPLRTRKPARVGVQFMGDIGHMSVRVEHVVRMVDVMAEAKQHTFFVPTKRPERIAAMRNMFTWPGNVWLGVSVEDQATADERIPILLRIPAAHRWVSVEPMLGVVDCDERWDMGALDWVVCGSETGPHKRPSRDEWIDSLRAQCVAAGVQFFGKVNSRGEEIGPREMP